MLELLPGFFMQTFGIGHIYQGRPVAGVAIMLSYWTLQAINAVLAFVLIGLVTAPLTWLLFMVFSSLDVAGEALERRKPKGYLAG